MAVQRLDKILASQGLGSRKEVTALITKGRVTVAGETCRMPDFKVNPERECIELDGKTIAYKSHIYIMMNKPAGVLSASRDPRQKTVMELLPPALCRRGLFPAGRLDKDTEGFLLITDDGDFAHRMLSPKKEIFKVYEAELDEEITPGDTELFNKGVILADGTKCRPARLYVPDGNPKNTVHVVICEGKFHQVKRMMNAIGRKIIHLRRIKIGNLPLDSSLNCGKCREMSISEVNKIFGRDNAQNSYAF